MARAFTSGNIITTAIGALSAGTSGNRTLVAAIRRNTSGGARFFGVATGTTRRTSLGLDSNGGIEYYAGTTALFNFGTVGRVPQGEWSVVAGSKASGTVAARLHSYVYSTGVMSHFNSDNTAANGSAGTSVNFGRALSTDTTLLSDIAALAVFERVLTDGEFEQLPFTLSTWIALNPAALWVLDQDNASQAVVDLTGGGANQTAITGTAASTDSVPNLGYGHPVIVVTRGDVTPSTTATAGLASVAADAHNGAPAVVVNAGTAEVAVAGQNAVGVVPSLFTGETPTNTDNDDGAPGITTAVTQRFAVAGYITAVRFYATDTVSGTYTGAMWEVTDDDVPGPGAGTLLASKVRPTAPTPGAWNEIVFDTPVAVAPGTLYRFGVHSDAGRYVNTVDIFVADVVNGQITADADGDNSGGFGAQSNGTYKIDSTLNFPRDTFDESNYYVDSVFALEAPTGTTTDAGLAAVTVTGEVATAAVAVNAGQADVTADAHNPDAAVAFTATAGVADVAVAGQDPAAAVTVAAGAADVAADGHNPAVAVAYSADAGVAEVTVDGHNPTVATAVTADAGTADVTVDGHNTTVTAASNAAADVALVGVDASTPTVSTSSSVTADAGVAEVAVTGENALVAVTTGAGLAAVTSDAYGATVSTSAEGTASAGTADVGVDGLNATAVPALTVTAGVAQVDAAADNPAVSLEVPAGVADVGVDASNATAEPALTVSAGTASVGVAADNPTTAVAVTAAAGIAEVDTTGFGPQITATVEVPAGTAEVTVDAFGATIDTATSVEAQALTAQADTDAFNALIAVLAMAGAAEVGVDAYSVPLQRTPGVLVASTTRPQLTATTRRGPTYTTGG